MSAEGAPTVRTIGRYTLYDEIASGGMATVHLGRLLGPAGFARTVAIKRLHAHFAKDPEFVSMFLDEARLAARIRHPNVASTLDVVARKGELFLVMEYIHGESFSRMTREAAKRDAYIPVEMVVSVLHGVMQGLHAAHEAKSESGDPLTIVHRDVSPQNIMLGSDGIARVLDFGVAKAIGRLQTTRDGQLKGKPAYMAPEQLRGRPIDRRTDVYAAGVVLWEALAGVRLFQADSPGETMARVLEMAVEAPSHKAADRTDRIPPSLDAVALKALSRDAGERYATALEMAMALEKAGVPIPNAREVGDYMRSTVGASLAERANRVHEIESAGSSGVEASDTEMGEPDIDQPDPELSTISGQSSSGGVSPVRASHSRWGMLATGAAIPVVAAGVIYLARTPPSAPLHVPATASSSLVASSPPPPPPTMVTELPSDSPSLGSSASVVPGATASGEAPVPKPHVERGRHPRSTPASTPPKGQAGGNMACNPPYTVDADGVHIPKAACE
jgi:eukaryotic-like serine/threonine-protein kinase